MLTRGRKRTIGLILLLLIILFGGGVWCWRQQQIAKWGEAGTIVEIKEDSNIVSALSSKRIIGSSIIFKWSCQINPQPGYYSLGNMTTRETCQALSQGPNILKITFPEGFSVAQVAQRLAENGLNLSDFYKLALPDEGHLFPDTYFFRIDAMPQDVIDKMTANFDERTAELDVSDNDLILASIIEREAKTNEERPMIAAVYLNRIKIGMRLEADPTVQYGRDLGLITSRDDLSNIKLWQPLSGGVTRTLDSKYNTYLNAGLPPTPICNPGIKSIEAALNPTPDFDALFFFHDGDGEIHFTNTLAEHQAAIRKYGL